LSTRDMLRCGSARLVGSAGLVEMCLFDWADATWSAQIGWDES
jgi:hypothetical protein